MKKVARKPSRPTVRKLVKASVPSRTETAAKAKPMKAMAVPVRAQKPARMVEPRPALAPVSKPVRPAASATRVLPVTASKPAAASHPRPAATATLMPLHEGIVYGPVRSRRLGRSLGINLTPAHLKLCSFNCSYCQYGWSEHSRRATEPGFEHWPSPPTVAKAVAAALRTLAAQGDRIDRLTLAGHGEPTMHPKFKEVVAALKKVRDEMGLTNVEVMIPFVRTVDELRKVLDIMTKNGLRRGENGLKVIVMCEIPANALLADDFLKHCDGFSIGSNDLTQCTLGADRDSGILTGFDERNHAVLRLMEMAIDACNKQGKYVGICGQAPSDFPEITSWLVDKGIQSISLNPDSVLPMTQVVLEMEQQKAEAEPSRKGAARSAGKKTQQRIAV